MCVVGCCAGVCVGWRNDTGRNMTGKKIVNLLPCMVFSVCRCFSVRFWYVKARQCGCCNAAVSACVCTKIVKTHTRTLHKTKATRKVFFMRITYASNTRSQHMHADHGMTMLTKIDHHSSPMLHTLPYSHAFTLAFTCPASQTHYCTRACCCSPY